MDIIRNIINLFFTKAIIFKNECEAGKICFGDIEIDLGPAGSDIMDTVKKVADDVWNLIFIVLGITAIIVGAYGTFLWSNSSGDPEKSKEARQKIINVLIGLLVPILIIMGISFLFTVLGVDFDAIFGS